MSSEKVRIKHDVKYDHSHVKQTNYTFSQEISKEKHQNVLALSDRNMTVCLFFFYVANALS